MKTEDKELLTKDLCARLPYMVKGLHRGQVRELFTIDSREANNACLQVDGYAAWFPIETFKPYLRSVSSMTGKEEIEWHELTLGQRFITLDNVERCVDWLNEHRFDYRNLIDKGLALEAPKGMYKN